MTNTPRVLTVIPAKARSRRLPGKNIALLNGKPLVVHAIEQAFSSGVCGDVCVYTDSTEVADIARSAGAEVPFLRNNDVDDVTAVGAAALNFMRSLRDREQRNYDIIGLLLTTSPLRRPEDIAACFHLLHENVALDATMSFNYVEKHPYWAWGQQPNGIMDPLFPGLCDIDREDAPKPYYVDGAVYFARTPFFEAAEGDQYQGKVGGYVVPPECSIDVDTPLDLEFCEYLLSKRSSG